MDFIDIVCVFPYICVCMVYVCGVFDVCDVHTQIFVCGVCSIA